MSTRKAKRIIDVRDLILEKIISGGQTGADRAGLWVGRYLGLETGGHAPRGWKTERGPRPDLLREYGLVEDTSQHYPPRTWKNAKNSDLTLLFGHASSGGSKLTFDTCQNLGKPIYGFPMVDDDPDYEGNGVVIRALLVQHQVRVLNVAGNRESITPGIFDYTRRVLLAALEGHV